MSRCSVLWRQDKLNVAGGLRLLLHQPRVGVHMSSIYRPVNLTPPTAPGKEPDKTKKKGDEALSKSLRLLVDNGLIKQSSCFGAYHLLPLALKAMEKLISLVDKHMMTLENCQKIQMPTLTSAHLWKATGRLEECRLELMRIQDRHSKEFLLSPTHEEAICDLLRNPPLSYRQLPQRLYQITEKFRDEHRPRFGLLRARQFLMKDLYTFDSTLEAAQQTYQAVNTVYQNLLSSLDLNWVQAQGSTGTIGGLVSHEFHLPCDIGEDSLLQCHACQQSFNQDLLEGELQQQLTSTGSGEPVSAAPPTCLHCQSSSSLSTLSSIEVAHSFLLGTKYTAPLQTLFTSEHSKKLPMQMGCFGLGVSRLLGAALEVNSTSEELRWPLRIAPYLISILPPKQGSKEEGAGQPLADNLYETLKTHFPNDVIYDNRVNQTIGKRLQDNKRLGIPFLVVCGKGVQDAAGPKLELHDLNGAQCTLLSSDEIVSHLCSVHREKIKLKL